MIRYLSIILDPTRMFPEYGCVDTDKKILVCRTTSEREADLLTDALNERVQRRRESAKALLAERTDGE